VPSGSARITDPPCTQWHAPPTWMDRDVYGRPLRKYCTICKGSKHYMLTYKKTNNLDLIGYSNNDSVGCADS
jgi:hypothetical protein